VLLLSLLLASGCRESASVISWSARELVAQLLVLEEGAEDVDAVEARRRLEEFAQRAVHASIEVHDAHVVSVYQRGDDWLTRPYFAMSYERESYLYLEEIDPAFQADLAHHPHWLSVAHTTGDRQLMFELAVDRSAFELSRAECRVDFTCELAAVIRGGRSVYCRTLTLEILSCEGDGPGE
jgi:hypothetical protein